jgi:hypothetical protein
MMKNRRCTANHSVLFFVNRMHYQITARESFWRHISTATEKGCSCIWMHFLFLFLAPLLVTLSDQPLKPFSPSRGVREHIIMLQQRQHLLRIHFPQQTRCSRWLSIEPDRSMLQRPGSYSALPNYRYTGTTSTTGITS